MRQIWKYPITQFGEVTLSMPVGARLLTCQLQRGVPTLWALVDATPGPRENRTVQLFGTGHDIPRTADYIGTVQVSTFVWHLFEVTEGLHGATRLGVTP